MLGLWLDLTLKVPSNISDSVMSVFLHLAV